MAEADDIRRAIRLSLTLAENALAAGLLLTPEAAPSVPPTHVPPPAGHSRDERPRAAELEPAEPPRAVAPSGAEPARDEPPRAGARGRSRDRRGQGQRRRGRGEGPQPSPNLARRATGQPPVEPRSCGRDTGPGYERQSYRGACPKRGARATARRSPLPRGRARSPTAPGRGVATTDGGLMTAGFVVHPPREWSHADVLAYMGRASPTHARTRGVVLRERPARRHSGARRVLLLHASYAQRGVCNSVMRELAGVAAPDAAPDEVLLPCRSGTLRVRLAAEQRGEPACAGPAQIPATAPPVSPPPERHTALGRATAPAEPAQAPAMAPPDGPPPGRFATVADGLDALSEFIRAEERSDEHLRRRRRRRQPPTRSGSPPGRLRRND